MSDNLIDFNTSLSNSLECSFQVLNDSTTKDCFFGRESLPFLLNVDVPDVSRESLGILHMNLPDTDTFEDFDVPGTSDGFLNVGFVNSPKLILPQLQNNVRISLGSNISSYSSIFPSPSEVELSTISKIYSVSHRSNLNEPLNDAFCCNTKFSFSFVKDKMGNNKWYESLEEFRIRMRSLPEPLMVEKRSSPLEDSFNKRSDGDRRCVSEKEPLVKAKILRSSFSDDLNELSGNEFNDSVFIEANHIASKIANGSVWDEDAENVNNLLDSTPQPDWDSEEEEEHPQNEVVKNEEIVFKEIDKLIHPVVQVKECENTTQYKVCDNFSGNKSDISQKSKSNEAKEILENLSLILNSENRSDQQKSKGLNLLNSLADILSQRHNLDDSGHSSIDAIEVERMPAKEQDFECYEVLDLCTKSANSEENIVVLDLSMKAKAQDSNQRLSQSFNVPTKKTVYNPPLTNSQTATTSLFGLDSSRNSSSGSKLNKLKPKKLEDKTTKGPLKAVLPLNNMAKGLQNKQLTPKVPLYKKTSTPVQKSKLKPMAQSTPENQNDTKSKHGVFSKNKFECPISPLARPRSYSDAGQKKSLNSTSRSGSAPELNTPTSNSSRASSSSIPIQNSFSRRNSASDLKQPKNVLMKRSFSYNKENLAKLNVSDGSVSKESSTRASLNSFGGKISGRTAAGKALKEINKKPTNLLSKINKSGLVGKENKM